MSETINRFLCFKIGVDEFAIPLLQVKQVIGMPEVTTVPQVPNYFLGIMNLRGQVISIIDLRLKLGVKPQDTSEKSVVIIDLDSHSIGMVVDEVNSVLTASPDQVSPPPDLGRTPASEYVTSVYRKENKLILMMDIMRILSREDKSAALRVAV